MKSEKVDDDDDDDDANPKPKRPNQIRRPAGECGAMMVMLVLSSARAACHHNLPGCNERMSRKTRGKLLYIYEQVALEDVLAFFISL